MDIPWVETNPSVVWVRLLRWSTAAIIFRIGFQLERNAL